MQVQAGGIVNSLVGKTLGDDGMENYIETYQSNLRRIIQKHKGMRGGGLGSATRFLAVASNNTLTTTGSNMQQQFANTRY